MLKIIFYDCAGIRTNIIQAGLIIIYSLRVGSFCLLILKDIYINAFSWNLERAVGPRCRARWASQHPPLPLSPLLPRCSSPGWGSASLLTISVHGGPSSRCSYLLHFASGLSLWLLDLAPPTQGKLELLRIWHPYPETFNQ